MNPFELSERTLESTPETLAEGLPHAIIAEVERLESENFNNTSVTGHSLLFNHTRCDSVYLNGNLADFGQKYPTLDLDAGFSNKTLSDSDNNLPETHLTRANFVEEIIPTRYDSVIQENSIGLSVEFVAMLNQLQRRWDMVMRTNSDLESQVMQQQQMILDLQKNNLELDGQVMQQHQLIFESRKQLNTLIEMNRINLQTSTDETLKQQEMIQFPKIDQQPAAEVSDRRQKKIAEVETVTVTTNERSLITDCGQTDQLQDIECAQSSAADKAETQSYSEKIGQAEHAAPSLQEDSFNQSHGLLRMKQVRSEQIRDVGEKRIKFKLDSIEESPENARNYRQQPKSYTCGECKKQFNRKNDFVIHFRIHSGEKPYECQVCNAAFTKSSNLKNHQITHSGEKPYVCKECGVAFSHASTLKTHQRTHSGEKPYECEVCNAAFTQSNHLRRHQRIHSGEKPYQCEVCNAAFTTSSQLIRHQRIHSGEKPYECEVCNAAFSSSSNLRKHQRTHSGEKPFICDICKKSFRLKRELAKHMDIHRGKKSHKCNECLKEFRHRYNLKKHLETHL